MKLKSIIIVMMFFVLVADRAMADTYVLPPEGTDLVGHLQTVYSQPGDTFPKIAMRYHVGYDALVKANPGSNRWAIKPGTPITLPTRYILPAAPRKGIIVNVPEKRLYYYPPAKDGEPPVVSIYAISVGRMDWNTPLGVTKIVKKQRDPAWYPPASIKKEHIEDGKPPLPDVVPAGPDNPLGLFAMRLGKPGYLIHGTNRPEGIGMQVTHGCIRMYPDDIETLFQKIPVGTEVNIVNQPVKAGWLNGVLYVEVHTPLPEDGIPHDVTVADAVKVIRKVVKQTIRVNAPKLERIVKAGNGIPTSIYDQKSEYRYR